MTSSTSSIESLIDAWFPPPETWSSFCCRRCESQMRVPFPPADGLCAACRDLARRPVEKPVELRLAEAGVPPRYASLTRASWERCYGSWREHPQLRRLLGWPHETRADSWLLLITSRGHGERKTGLATAVLGEALTHGLGGCWTSQSAWLRRLKASWSGGEPEHAVWSRVAEAGVLVFDDLGVEGPGRPGQGWWRTQVTQLLHHREDYRLPTIVTAKLESWRDVATIHPSLLSRMNVPLKIALPPRR